MGQCADVLVDHNIADDNAIGLEVELSSRVIVEDNTSTDNTVGAVVQILPRRAVTVTHDVLVRATCCRATTGPTPSRDRASWAGCQRNRRPNMAGNNVRIIDNVVSGNRSGGIGVVSLPPDLLALEEALDPSPTAARSGATWPGNGYDPDPDSRCSGCPAPTWSGTAPGVRTSRC